MQPLIISTMVQGLMRARFAFALLLPLAGSACGGGMEPSGGTDVAGVWDATIESTSQFSGGPVISCAISWAMAIQAGTSTPLALQTVIPLPTRITCDDGFSGPWIYRSFTFIVRQEGSNVVLLTAERLDTFAVATLSGDTMTGEMSKRLFQSATFRATRRSGPDPNLQPATMTTGATYADVEIGDTLRAIAQVEDGYGQPIGTFAVVWTSSDSGLATVDSDGLIHGVAPGQARIIGAVAEIRDSFIIEVLPPAASVAITQAPDSMIVPGSEAIGAVAKNAAGEVLPGRRFTWKSSNPALAVVDQFGIVSALAPGSVTITARSTVVSASVTFPVLPRVAHVEISPAGTALQIGRTLQFTAALFDAQGQVITGRPVDWTVGNTEIMSVDGNGLVQSIMAGTAQLTATVEDASATLDVTSRMDGPLGSLSAGQSHTCGLATTGSVYCWGGNVLGQLGPSPGSGTGPVLVPSPEQFASLAAGGAHTCALNQAGAAFCWGSNSFGQLGAASGAPGEVMAVSGGIAFTRISAGFEYTCGLEAGGSAWCWGYNELGTLGRGTDDLLPHTSPAAVVGGHAFTSIAAGENTVCALTAAGEAWCWGSNRFGNLGLGTQDDGAHSTPVHAAPGLTFSVIAPALTRTCGIAAAGVVYCWGQDQLTPAPFDATGGYTELEAGQLNLCRVNGAGTVSCVGDEDIGNVPQEAAARLTVGSHHACARLVASGKFVCWGLDGNGQLGTGEAFAGPGPVEPLGQP